MAKKRGFAAMDKLLTRSIASKGGKAAQASGRAHRFNHEEAVAAGRKGGLAAQKNRTNVAAAATPVCLEEPTVVYH